VYLNSGKEIFKLYNPKISEKTSSNFIIRWIFLKFYRAHENAIGWKK